MLLSSYERAYRFLCVENNMDNKRLLNQYLYAVSANIQAYINNDLELKSRVEYHDIQNLEREFFVKSHPVVSVASVYTDYLGLFDGSQQLLSDYFIGARARSVVVQFPEMPGKRTLKITYTGGVSTTGTLSTFAVSGVTGTFLVDKFLHGVTSGAVGIIKSFTPNTSIQVDVLYGVFAVGETLHMQATEGGTDVGGIAATLASKTVEALCEVFPEITLACDLQMRYNIKTKDDFEVISVGKDGTMRRNSQHYMTPNGSYNDLQPEVRSLLNKHRRYILQ